MEREALEELVGILKEMGYPHVELESSPEGFNVNADIYARNSNKAMAIFLRNRPHVPEFLIHRIATTKSPILDVRIYIVFLAGLDKDSAENVSLYGIGVAKLAHGELEILSPSINFSDRAPEKEEKLREAAKKVSQIDVFPSTIQNEDEREAIVSIVTEIRETHQVPIFEKLVEKDRRYTITETEVRKNIVAYLKETDIFVCALGEKHSKMVDFEVRNSFRYVDNGRIIVLVKSVSKNKRDRKQNILINWLQGRKHKYLPYVDIADFVRTVRKQLYLEVRSFYTEAGVECPY